MGTFSLHEVHDHKLLTTAKHFGNFYIFPKGRTKPSQSSRAESITLSTSRSRRHWGNWKPRGAGRVLQLDPLEQLLGWFIYRENHTYAYTQTHTQHVYTYIHTERDRDIDTHTETDRQRHIWTDTQR